jgi:pimeloyl-ACP methyl ester carboxylesterase
MSVLSAAPAPRGRLVDIGGGRRLHVRLAGPLDASPLVVLEAGAFGFSADWETVQAQLAEAGFRSLAYDRAGLGFSDPAPAPRDAAAIAADLERLLTVLGEAGPFIYCGHSMAGLHAPLFAARHAGALAGLVLVDASRPEGTQSPSLARAVGAFALLCRAAAAGAWLGLLRPLAVLGLGNAIGVEGPADLEKRWAFADPGHNHAAALEVEAWLPSAQQALGVGALRPELPVMAILAGRQGAASSLGLDDGDVVRVKGATHASLLGPRHAEVIVSSVARVRDAARA